MGDPSDGDEAGEPDVALELGVRGALLRASQEESGDLLGHLANLLGGALPALTKVETRGGFLSAKKIASVRVELADNHFSLARAKTGLVAEKHKIVRGVRLSTRQTPVDEWIRELAAEVGRLAEAASPAYLHRCLDDLSTALPHAERVMVPGVGHNGPDMDDPPRIAAELRPFFSVPPISPVTSD